MFTINSSNYYLVLPFLIHVIYIVLLVIGVFFSDYKFMLYYVFSLLFVNIVWLMYGCIFKDYEKYIICNSNSNIETEKEEACKDVNSYKTSVTFTLDPWYIISWIFIVLCFWRYVYKYNFFNIPYNISIICYVSFLLLYCLILFMPTLEHYQKYKNKRIFMLYIISLMGSIAMMIVLFKKSLK